MSVCVVISRPKAVPTTSPAGASLADKPPNMGRPYRKHPANLRQIGAPASAATREEVLYDLHSQVVEQLRAVGVAAHEHELLVGLSALVIHVLSVFGELTIHRPG